MIRVFLLLVFLLNSVISFADGCSGAATFTVTYDQAGNCYTFANTTNNDCNSSGICTWDFGDGSPTVTTIGNYKILKFTSSGSYTA